MNKKIAIIGGSGLDNPDILKDPVEKEHNNKYGQPSSTLTCGKLCGVDVVILSRHGKDHGISPTKINYLANIRALKDEGCTHVLAATAVGSLRRKLNRATWYFPPSS